MGRISAGACVNGFYDQVVAVLAQHGFSFLKPGKGSHQWWSNGRVKVQVPTHCKSRHTANAVMKQAGIAHKF
ncbi:MAG: type II toxin-antitoxin system HicA family toxin [Burkholderiaceae bacterium]|nr:MAG: type II toxin-antitoxin system HicA family toxin [Burkholderiaceae bacterium]